MLSKMKTVVSDDQVSYFGNDLGTEGSSILAIKRIDSLDNQLTITECSELVTYITAGSLSYARESGKLCTLGRGAVVMSSDSNYQLDSSDDFEAIQFLVNATETDSRYQDHKYKWKLRINMWLEIVSSHIGEANIRLESDVSIHVIMLDQTLSEGFAVDADRQAYLIQLEGTSDVSGVKLNAGEGLEINGTDIIVSALTNSHCIIIEFAANK